jgi:PadR family transcriptional regulator, regulatory protein PadR
MNSQFKKGVIELIVLRLFTQYKLSTFEVLEQLRDPLEVNENTVYPVIRRLHAEGYLDVEKKELPVGAPRKYFYATNKGNQYVEELQKDWRMFVETVDHLLGEKDE